jgi:TatD DNase family protein
VTPASGDDANPGVGVQASAVDTHCHLFLIERDPAEVLGQARDSGVGTVVCPGVDLSSSRRALDLAESFDGVYATAGTHPHDASGFDLETAAETAELLSHPRVVAVGECGLDFYRMRSAREDQIRALRVHAWLARETGMPMVVHVRDAWEDVFRVLDEADARRVVLHCFTGDASIAGACTSRGWYLSFAGNITYPKNAYLREVAATVTLDRVLVETDSPFLAPQRVRGRENSPANVVDVIGAIAKARGEDVDDVRSATSRNAADAFPRLK